jgi:hypothetical protein
VGGHAPGDRVELAPVGFTPATDRHDRRAVARTDRLTGSGDDARPTGGRGVTRRARRARAR